MPCYACLFEAKSIQEYILRSGRLRHIVGASELLDSLTRALLDAVLAALGPVNADKVRLSRRAGGAVYLFADDAAVRDAFRDLWSLTVRQYAPDLECVIAVAEGTTDHAAYRAAADRLQAARNRQPPLLPAGTPVSRYATRTGEPAVGSDPKLGLQDQATDRFGRRAFWRRETDGLTSRFAPDLTVDAWPRNLDYDPDDPEERKSVFPFLKDNRYLGLLHLDGNGLGQLIQRLARRVESSPQDFVPLFRDFSDAVAAATTAAAQCATSAVLRPRTSASGLLPARPIVLGGDDLTILLRADLALPFARSFLTAFEAASREGLAKLRKDHPEAADVIPDCLTAGGGIAFVKSNHPFHLGHALVDSIAGLAKRRAKKSLADGARIPPTLAFHRVTTACHGVYQEILESELTCGPENRKVVTTLGVYGLDQHTDGLPALTDLEDLAALLGDEDMARGPTRQVLTLLGQDLDGAERRYARWREVMGERARDRLQKFDTLLGRLCEPGGGFATYLPVSKDGTPHRTPLGDLTALLAVTQGAGEDQTTDAEDAP